MNNKKSYSNVQFVSKRDVQIFNSCIQPANTHNAVIALLVISKNRLTTR